MQVDKDMTIQKIIELDEGTANYLMASGMHCLGCAMAHGETIEQACAVHGIDVENLINDINTYLADK